MEKDRLVREERIWAVSGEDPDDGRPARFAYYTNHAAAEADARKRGARVVPTALWRDPSTGHYFEGHLRRVPVDVPTREEVLARLTPAEREALGFGDGNR